MPGLYDIIGGNANISVSNTPGLYNINSSVTVLNSAQQLLSLLSQSGNVNFALDSTTSNTKVLAYTANIGTPAGTFGNIDYFPVITLTADGRITNVSTISFATAIGTYGNANVAAYLPTYTGTLDNSSTIISLYANAASQQTEIIALTSNAAAQAIDINTLFANAASQATSINSINANVTAANAAIVTVQNNLNDFETYANLHFGTSNYANANVAAYLPVYGGTIDATQVSNVALVNIASQGTIQMQYDPSGAYNPYNIDTGSWAYLDSSGFVFESNVLGLGPTNTVIFDNGGGVTATGNVSGHDLYSVGNIIAGEIVTADSFTTTKGVFYPNNAPYGVTRIIAGANIVVSPASGIGDVTISSTGGGGGGGSGGQGYYGSFFDTTDQYANVASQSYAMKLNSTAGSNGVTITNGNAMTFSYAGVYNVQFSVQLVNTDNVTHEANIWLSQNGTNVPDSTGQVTIPGRKSITEPGTSIVSWNYVLPVGTNDNLQLIWQTDANSDVVRLDTINAGTSPTRPSIPSVIATATQVANTLETLIGNVYLVGDITGNGNTGTAITTTLSATGVTAGTYGNIDKIPQFVVDAQGRITSASNISFTPTANISTLGWPGATTTIQGNTVTTTATYNANVYVETPVLGGFANTQSNVLVYSDLRSLPPGGAYGHVDINSRGTGYGTGFINLRATGDGNSTSSISILADGDNTAQISIISIAATNQAGEIRLTAGNPAYSGPNEKGAFRITANTIYQTANIIQIQTPSFIANANIQTTGGYFVGDGRYLTNVPSSYGNTQVAAYLPTYTGNLSPANLLSSGVVTATGNISGANFTTAGQINATGQIVTSANVTAANVVATSRLVTTDGIFWANGTAFTSGGAGSQSPWTGNIDGAGFYISNSINSTVREKVYAIGTVNGTLSVDANLGSIQTATVASNITFNTNNITNLFSGQSITLVLTQGTNANLRLLTSNLKWANGSKTLTTANAAIDTINITYDGTNYLAALSKGYQ